MIFGTDEDHGVNGIDRVMNTETAHSLHRGRKPARAALPPAEGGPRTVRRSATGLTERLKR